MASCRSARLGLSNARNEYKAAWQRLTVVMGVPNGPGGSDG